RSAAVNLCGERGANLRKCAFNLAIACSIGLRSGLTSSFSEPDDANKVDRLIFESAAQLHPSIYQAVAPGATSCCSYHGRHGQRSAGPPLMNGWAVSRCW